jgi:hypothetical protein
MNKRLSNLSTIMNSLPLLLALGALLLFAVGYGAHKIWGDNNVVEEIAEELLKQDYNISVEFSGR